MHFIEDRFKPEPCSVNTNPLDKAVNNAPSNADNVIIKNAVDDALSNTINEAVNKSTKPTVKEFPPEDGADIRDVTKSTK